VVITDESLGATAVSIGRKYLMNFTVDSDAQITATIPSKAETAASWMGRRVSSAKHMNKKAAPR